MMVAPEVRAEIETTVERLIAFLDALDAPGEDLEPEGDEEPDADGEPSLGSLENHPSSAISCIFLDGGWDGSFRAGDGSQLGWAMGNRHDLEWEHDGREPECEDEGAQSDDEPELGWTGHGRGWSQVLDGDGSWGASGYGEPNLGACETGPGSQLNWTKGYTPDDEREQACEDEGAQCDDEGWRESGYADRDALDAEDCDFVPYSHIVMVSQENGDKTPSVLSVTGVCWFYDGSGHRIAEAMLADWALRRVEKARHG